MSVKVSSWVWHGEETAEISGNEMILLLALADVADDNGRCRFVADDDDLTYPTLARKARVSTRTIIRMIASLRESGLLDQVKGTKSRPNEFQIMVPWAQAFGDNLAQNESGSGDSLAPNIADSVTPVTLFGDNPGARSSLKRIDVVNGDLTFLSFWQVYPRKAGKEAARRAFEKAVKSASVHEVLDGARRFAADPNLPEKQYIPHPATWLNAGRWDDEPLPARDRPVGPRDMDDAEEWMRR